MFNFVLKDHNMSLCFPVDRDIFSTKMGQWLEENNIDYRISSFDEDMATDKNYQLHTVYIIESIDFFYEEDIVAFKLRWS